MSVHQIDFWHQRHQCNLKAEGSKVTQTISLKGPRRPGIPTVKS